MLEISDINAGYGDVQVLYDLSFTVGQGEIVALLGANGAGKTTTLWAISGLVRPSSGRIRFDGEELLRMPAHRLPELGIAHVPQGRGVFQTLNVLENLQIGAYSPRSKADRRRTMGMVFELFPKLYERQKQEARTLSGGEQQMLAIGRALMLKPRLLMLDEPSLGLAPVVVEMVFKKIEEIGRTGVAILLVEQNLAQALSVAHRGYVLETGRITVQGSSAELQNNPYVKEAYLGL
ncbi:MAG: ABC transporter ATP-binding protein [Chloroflexota bacterium]